MSLRQEVFASDWEQVKQSALHSARLQATATSKKALSKVKKGTFLSKLTAVTITCKEEIL
jgi:hypothetical protein